MIGGDDPDMPTLADPTTGQLLSPAPSPLAAAATAAAASPGELLLPGEPADPRSSPERQLALDAHRLAQLLRLRRPPGRWAGAAFGRHVDLVRTHLSPIADRRMLAASFGREAFHGVSRSRHRDLTLSPVRVAYALRWLELSDDGPWDSWPGLIDAATGAPAR